MRDMISTTPLAEYIDMMWNRLAIEMPKHEHITNWWVSLHPPGISGRPDKGVGFVEVHGVSANKRILYRADMHAVQRGAIVGVEMLETVVELHIRKFVEAMTP